MQTHRERIDRFKNKNSHFEEFLDMHEPDEYSNEGSFKRLVKVSAAYNPNRISETEHGRAFTEPKWEFHKHYEDGSKEEIREHQYMTMKRFNDLPDDSWIKNNWFEKNDD